MYAGLKITDKPALLDAKSRGAEWVARDKDDELVGFRLKPQKYVDIELNSDHWERTQAGNDFDVMPSDEPLQFIQWSDAEPVNIDLALAQIAEMENAEKPTCPYCSTDAFSPSRVGIYGENGFSPFHIYLSGGFVRDGEQFDYCPKCARRINSPYTEGEQEDTADEG